MRWLPATLVLVLAALLANPVVAADQDRARAAVQSGSALPLNQILSRLRGRYSGQLLDASLNQVGGGRWVYNIRLLDQSGTVRALTVDARTANVLNVREGGRR